MHIRFLLLPAIAFFMSSCRDELKPGSAAPEPGAPEPVVEKGIAQEKDADFVGLPEKEGAALAEKRGLKQRVVSVDGQLRPTTRDYRKDRVNFELEGGKIVKVSRG
jgi:hypothetical protein